MEPVRLEVWSDIACPACRAGHERLRQLLAEEEPGSVEVAHRAFELGTGPDTRLAHRLVKVAEHARDPAAGLDALHALFEAHFTEGRDVSDPDVAVEVVARAARLKPEALRAAADAGAGEPEVAADEELATRIGIQGVPYLLADRRVAVSGAHEPAVLRRVLATARERRAEVA